MFSQWAIGGVYENRDYWNGCNGQGDRQACCRCWLQRHIEQHPREVRVAQAIGALAGSAQEAASYGDLVVLAVPLYASRSLPARELTGKVVVDLLNYFPHRDGVIEVLQNGELTTSELLAQQLPGAYVVKALNSITVEDLLFEPIDVGGLAESWRFERFRPVYCVALDAEAMRATLAATSRETIVPDGYWQYISQSASIGQNPPNSPTANRSARNVY